MANIVANEPSRFLAELPADDLHWSGRDAELDAAHKEEMASSHIAASLSRKSPSPTERDLGAALRARADTLAA